MVPLVINSIFFLVITITTRNIFQYFLTAMHDSTNVLFFRLYSANDPVWLTKGAPYHLLHVLAKLLEKFADAPSTVLTNER